MIKVLIADDHQMMREGWRTILSNVDQFQVIGEVSKGEEIMTFMQQDTPDLLVTDIDMGNRRDDGLQAIRSIKARYAQLPILVVTMHDEIGFIEEAIEAGADGYLLKSNSTDEMITAMQQLAVGKTYYSQEVMRTLTGRMMRKNESNHIHLTNQEKKVLPFLCQGLTSKQVGDKMGLSHNTVNTYRKALYAKFDVNNISELNNKARDLGYVK